jgi:hypothetical protein
MTRSTLLPWTQLRDLPKKSRMYHSWLIESVLIRGRSTLWCANQIEADPRFVLRDFEKALNGEVEIE